MASTEKPGPRPASDNNTSSGSKLVSYYVEQLGIALDQLIPAKRVLLFARALSDLNDSQIRYGFEQALKLFKPEYGTFFPAPAQIREWALEYRPKQLGVGHSWATSDCPWCHGEGRLLAWWRSHIEERDGGFIEVQERKHVRQYRGTSDYVPEPDDWTVLFRCSCPAGERDTIPKGWPRFGPETPERKEKPL